MEILKFIPHVDPTLTLILRSEGPNACGQCHHGKRQLGSITFAPSVRYFPSPFLVLLDPEAEQRREWDLKGKGMASLSYVSYNSGGPFPGYSGLLRSDLG